jgi:hypothetical protein
MITRESEKKNPFIYVFCLLLYFSNYFDSSFSFKFQCRTTYFHNDEKNQNVEYYFNKNGCCVPRVSRLNCCTRFRFILHEKKKLFSFIFYVPGKRIEFAALTLWAALGTVFFVSIDRSPRFSLFSSIYFSTRFITNQFSTYIRRATMYSAGFRVSLRKHFLGPTYKYNRTNSFFCFFFLFIVLRHRKTKWLTE